LRFNFCILRLKMLETKLYYIKIHLILLILLSLIQISCNDSNVDNISSIEETKEESTDAMKLGIKIFAPTPYPEIYFNDLIHPCVRFIPEGLNGHQWWMIATPFRGGDRFIENPILYYGDSRPEGLPPLMWTPSAIIADTPLPYGAYNSDPNLFWDGKGLWVFWRENWSESCKKLNLARAIFGRYSDDGIKFRDKKFFAGEKTTTEDSHISPTVIEIDGKIKLYGVKHQLEAPRAPWGLTIWEIENNDLEKNVFVKTKDIQPVYKQGFDLWHTDFFKYNSLVYCLATPEVADEILLGVSRDGEHFTFWDKPLLSTKGTGREYFYKASAMVYNDVFYLWTPVAEKGVSPRTTRIWMSEIKFEELLKNIKSDFHFQSPVFTDTNTIKLSSSNN
jgi:hypothetical protein